jgi:hypothetical protein
MLKIFRDLAAKDGYVTIGEGLFVLPEDQKNAQQTHCHLQFQKNRQGGCRAIRNNIYTPRSDYKISLSEVESYIKNFEKGAAKVSDVPYVQGSPEGFMQLGYARRTPQTMVVKFHRHVGGFTKFRFDLFSHPATDDRQVAIRAFEPNQTMTEEQFYQQDLKTWLSGKIRSRALDGQLHRLIEELEQRRASGSWHGPEEILGQS